MEGWIIHFPSKVQLNSFPFFFQINKRKKKNQALAFEILHADKVQRA